MACRSVDPWQPATSTACTSRTIPARRNARDWQHADRAGLVVKHDHGAGAEAAARCLHRVEIHGYVEVLGEEKIGRGAARQQPAKLVSVAHAAGVLFQNLAQGGAHRQFPQARVLHPSAGAVQLGAAIARYGSGS